MFEYHPVARTATPSKILWTASISPTLTAHFTPRARPRFFVVATTPSNGYAIRLTAVDLDLAYHASNGITACRVDASPPTAPLLPDGSYDGVIFPAHHIGLVQFLYDGTRTAHLELTAGASPQYYLLRDSVESEALLAFVVKVAVEPDSMWILKPHLKLADGLRVLYEKNKLMT